MKQQTSSIKLNNSNTIIGVRPLSFGEGFGGEVAKNSPKNKKLPP